MDYPPVRPGLELFLPGRDPAMSAVFTCPECHGPIIEGETTVTERGDVLGQTYIRCSHCNAIVWEDWDGTWQPKEKVMNEALLRKLREPLYYSDEWDDYRAMLINPVRDVARKLSLLKIVFDKMELSVRTFPRSAERLNYLAQSMVCHFLGHHWKCFSIFLGDDFRNAKRHSVVRCDRCGDFKVLDLSLLKKRKEQEDEQKTEKVLWFMHTR